MEKKEIKRSAKRTEEHNEVTERKKKKKRGLILLLIFITMAIGIYNARDSTTGPVVEEEDQNDSFYREKLKDRGFGDDGTLNLTDVELLRAELQEKTDGSFINPRVNTNPVYKNGKVNWMLENKPNNRYLLQVDVITEGGDVIYESPTLKPGQIVQEVKVDFEKMSKGDHEVTVLFNVYDPETEYFLVQHPIKGVNLTIN